MEADIMIIKKEHWYDVSCVKDTFFFFFFFLTERMWNCPESFNKVGQFHMQRVSPFPPIPQSANQQAQWIRVVSIFTRHEAPWFLSLGVVEGQRVWEQHPIHCWTQSGHASPRRYVPYRKKSFFGWWITFLVRFKCVISEKRVIWKLQSDW